MLKFLTANLGTIVVCAVLLLIVVLIVINLINKKKKGQSTCGCGCDNCPSSGVCHKKSTQPPQEIDTTTTRNRHNHKIIIAESIIFNFYLDKIFKNGE